MFSLIIAIISIALVAALAIASVYYGGSAFTSGSAKASASTLVNQAQQIAAAWTMYANDNGGSAPADISTALVPNYLQSVPTAPASVTTGTWGISGSNVEVSVTSSNVCSEVNSEAGLGTAVSATQPTGAVYSCFGSASPYTFAYTE